MRSLTLLLLIGSAISQNVSLCDKYTTALLGTNNATNQYTLLTLLVNTVVIGNYTQPNKNAVPGILAQGTYNNVTVNLLPYFDGTLASSNRGGSSGVSINFLDDGGAAPLKMNKPSNGMTSNQYFLLTHLYQFFGKLLGCSVGPQYSGHAMYPAHAFMNLDPNQLGYFITQVGLAAASFGVSTADITTVGTALQQLFGYRCSPATTVIPEMGPTLNSICTNSQCPLDPKANCSAYPNNGVAVMPMKANASGTSSMVPSSTAKPPQGNGASTAVHVGIGMLSVAIGCALLM